GSRLPAVRAPGPAACRSQARGPADAVPAPGEAFAGAGGERTGDRTVRAAAGADAAESRLPARAVAAVVAVPPGAACGARRGDAVVACIPGRSQGALVAGRGSGRSLLSSSLLAVDAAGVAAAAGIVHVQERGPRIGEEAFDQRFQARALIDFRIEHPALRVVRAHRQQATALLLWHPVAEHRLRPRRFAHEDRARRAVGAVGIQVV